MPCSEIRLATGEIRKADEILLRNMKFLHTRCKSDKLDLTHLRWKESALQ